MNTWVVPFHDAPRKDPRGVDRLSQPEASMDVPVEDLAGPLLGNADSSGDFGNVAPGDDARRSVGSSSHGNSMNPESALRHEKLEGK